MTKPLFIDIARGRLGRFEKVEKGDEIGLIDVIYYPAVCQAGLGAVLKKRIKNLPESALIGPIAPISDINKEGLYVLIRGETNTKPLLDRIGIDLGDKVEKMDRTMRLLTRKGKIQEHREFLRDREEKQKKAEEKERRPRSFSMEDDFRDRV